MSAAIFLVLFAVFTVVDCYVYSRAKFPERMSFNFGLLGCGFYAYYKVGRDSE